MAEHANVREFVGATRSRAESVEFGDTARAEIEALFHGSLVCHGQPNRHG